jgi:hypothetical protein
MSKMANQNKTKGTVSLLERKRRDLVQLLTKGVFRRSDHFHYYFMRWRSETEDALLRIFGKDSRELKKFELAAHLAPVRGSSVTLSEHRRKTMLRAAAELEAILSSIEESGIPEKCEILGRQGQPDLAAQPPSRAAKVPNYLFEKMQLHPRIIKASKSLFFQAITRKPFLRHSKASAISSRRKPSYLWMGRISWRKRLGRRTPLLG